MQERCLCSASRSFPPLFLAAHWSVAVAWTCGTGAKLLRFNQQFLGAVVDEALRSQGPSGQKPPCRGLLRAVSRPLLNSCPQTTRTCTHTLALTSQRLGKGELDRMAAQDKRVRAEEARGNGNRRVMRQPSLMHLSCVTRMGQFCWCSIFMYMYKDPRKLCGQYVRW
jgi:hypothetical protein